MGKQPLTARLNKSLAGKPLYNPMAPKISKTRLLENITRQNVPEDLYMQGEAEEQSTVKPSEVGVFRNPTLQANVLNQDKHVKQERNEQQLFEN